MFFLLYKCGYNFTHSWHITFLQLYISQLEAFLVKELKLYEDVFACLIFLLRSKAGCPEDLSKCAIILFELIFFLLERYFQLWSNQRNGIASKEFVGAWQVCKPDRSVRKTNIRMQMRTMSSEKFYFSNYSHFQAF